MAASSIQIISSTHKESGSPYPTIEKKADILAVLGNFGKVEEEGYEEFLGGLATTFQYIFIVPGNEDYYSQQYSMEEMNEKINKICQKHNNINFLNNKSVVINNIRYIGSTLWPQIPKENANELQSSLADFSNILIGKDKHVITPRDYNKLHKDDVEFVSNTIMAAKSARTHRVVVLSHFPPSSAGTFDATGLSAALKNSYFTDMEHVMGPPISLWAFGHTNKECTVNISPGTTLASNPHSSSSFKANKTLPLPSNSPAASNKPNFNMLSAPDDEDDDIDDDETSRIMELLTQKKQDLKTISTQKRKYFDKPDEDEQKEVPETKVAKSTQENKEEKIEYSEEDELESYLKDSKPAPAQQAPTPPAKKQKDFKF